MDNSYENHNDNARMLESLVDTMINCIRFVIDGSNPYYAGLTDHSIMNFKDFDNPSNSYTLVIYMTSGIECEAEIAINDLIINGKNIHVGGTLYTIECNRRNINSIKNAFYQYAMETNN